MVDAGLEYDLVSQSSSWFQLLGPGDVLAVACVVLGVAEMGLKWLWGGV